MKISIPKNCIVCGNYFASSNNMFMCENGHSYYIAVEQHNNTIQIHYFNLCLPNKIVFSWDLLSSQCHIKLLKPPNRLYYEIAVVLPWMDIPERINVDSFYQKVKTWITFS